MREYFCDEGTEKEVVKIETRAQTYDEVSQEMKVFRCSQAYICLYTYALSLSFSPSLSLSLSLARARARAQVHTYTHARAQTE